MTMAIVVGLMENRHDSHRMIEECVKDGGKEYECHQKLKPSYNIFPIITNCHGEKK